MLKKSLLIHSSDNVAVLLEDARSGDSILVNQREITLRESIEFGHKVSICAIKAEDDVCKYGNVIGYMLADIPEGTWIHNHNMGCRRGQ